MSGSTPAPRRHAADPGLLGLSAFVITQAMLNAANAHLVPPAAANFFIPTVLATGGLVQLLCCAFAYLGGDSFGTTVFGIYGSFFLGLGAFVLLEEMHLLVFGAAAGTAFGAFILTWGLFTVGITVIAFRESLLLGVMFVLISMAFLGGAAHFLLGADSGYGGWAGVASAAVGFFLVIRGLWHATAPESQAALGDQTVDAREWPQPRATVTAP